MYLKSLNLKGFKSFADRSVLSLEPGITAIVGPNGSGKSNISDAVLWVLGERSARNLRGQAMEDIIFSGSAARKAVSVAEVDLVLDNSDNTLPVDFDEVVVTRRMYRSGESEYLVNGVVARRLDVLDILHDTGLGTGTHSIISQGSLDSILQSKPEDRRALIEEAAGVLKHKQRKEKSARKIAAMDAHLDRVRDVAGEVARQLRPLERKAKRAAAYKEASSQLADVKLAIAVDDLRALQRQWDRACAMEKSLLDEVDARRDSVTSAEQKVSDFQELMKRESEDAGELAKRQRRAENLSERLDSAEMLLRERRRAAVASEADLRAAIEGAGARREEAQRELASAREQLASAKGSSLKADEEVAALTEEKARVDESLRATRAEMDALGRGIDELEKQIDGVRREREQLQESLANGLAHVKLVEARKVELASSLEKAKRDQEQAAEAASQAKRKLDELQERDRAGQEELSARMEQREAHRAARDAAHEAVRLAESEIKALEQAMRTSQEEDPALVWVLDHSEMFGGEVSTLSSSLKVGAGLESLVESLLGADLAALSIEDDKTAAAIAEALAEGGLAGDVSLVMRGFAGARALGDARQAHVGHALLDDLAYGDEMAPIVEALLGDVVVCADRQQALEASARGDSGLRYLSLDGCVAYPSGMVKVFGAARSAEDGVLARERRLDDLKASLEAHQRELQEAQAAASKADEEFRRAQAESLKLNQELANHKGVCAAAKTDEERTSQRLASVMDEVSDIDRQVETAKKTVDELRPEMERADAKLAELGEARARSIADRQEKSEQFEPVQKRSELLGEKLSEAKLSAAKYDERRRYAERIVSARSQDLEKMDADEAEAQRSLIVKGKAVQRGQELLVVFERLSTGLSAKARVLEEALNASESATHSVHADAATARDAARRAHDEYDAASARMSQARVEKSRLEVQVEAAVNAVVRDCGTPLEVAEQMPALENRQEAEDERYRLERRIKNMGAINPDAAEEYEQLKERYDFLAGQLSDMEAARRSLNRIVRVIDARMKDDFAKTFEQVNANFNEIFSLLFPGGTAHLSLEDPDDIENSGVEVTAQPRGKRLTKMMLMSGGEKSLTALALLFAVYKTRTTPFYILDEVEAALDDTNLRRLISYIDTLRASTQLIMITHQRRTMEMADVLFGVSMQADGVTKVISQKLERALEQAS